VADDHVLFLELFSALLEPDFELVGTAEDGAWLVEKTLRLEPDVVVLDITMPRLDGLSAASRLRRDLPDLKLVFLTSHEERRMLEQALALGASGYLLKSAAPAELRQAIHRALEGGVYVTPTLENRDPNPLTPRQVSVVRLLAEGCSMKEAAVRLRVTPRTIAFHKYEAMRRLDLESSAQLVRYACREGLVNGC
jgi:DNA-binding NarL/FixJ family response regulator